MNGGWLPTDHACSVCLGRIMVSVSDRMAFWCPCCGAESTGSPATICGCGAINDTGKQLFRCAPNPMPTVTNPALVVIVTVGAASF